MSDLLTTRKKNRDSCSVNESFITPRCTLTGVFGSVRGQAASILNPKALQCNIGMEGGRNEEMLSIMVT
jgi:hypothetical protein